MENRFNVRVYGVLIDEQRRVLLSDEVVHGDEITKFPGGGLEFGEGPVECIIREFKEELDADVKVVEHLYTTEFFQRSAWRSTDQVLSIYYVVDLKGDLDLNCTDDELFRWVSVADLSAEEMTLPIDKVVADMIIDRWK